MTDGQEVNRLKLEVEALKKEIALVREDAQIEILRLEKRIGELVKEKDIELIEKVKEKSSFFGILLSVPIGK